MAWIRTIDPDDAEGPLAVIYRDALARAGKVWNVVRLQSVNPRQLRSGLGLYRSLMITDSALPRRVTETLAVVVSRANDCHY